MNLVQKLDASIELCAKIKEQIEADCHVNSNELGGKTLKEYEKVRETHLACIKQIYEKLVTFRLLMGDV